MRKMTECKIQNQDNVLGYIYKLLFKYDTETEQIKKLYDKIDAKFQKSNSSGSKGRFTE